MDIIKALLNRILIFFDTVGKRLTHLPAKTRRRVFLLSAILLLLLLLLLILCVSSCRSTGEEASVEALESAARTRVRGTMSGGSTVQVRSEATVRLSSEVHPVRDPNAVSATWPPDDPLTDEPEDNPDVPNDEQATPDVPIDGKKASELSSTSDAPESTPEPGSQYATLRKKDKSAAVTDLQNRLMELGYLDIDEPTDYFGSSTETAVILFQRQHELKQDGIAGNETLTLLYGDSAQHYCLKEGAEGEDVKALQEQLVDLGYMDEKEVDRVYGPVTLAAVEAFQKRNGLHVDGLAGEKTLEVLYSEDAKMSRELQKQQEAEEDEKKRTEKETPKPTPTKKAPSKTSSSKKKTPTPKPTKKPTPTPKKDQRIDKFIAAAKSKVGCEYVLGAKGPNKFDCSGLIYWCLKQAGVGGTRLNALGYSHKSGWKLIENMNSLKKGDILFFRSDKEKYVNHTGIYLGGGTMIDASSGHGRVVKRAISPYFKRNFVCARRPWRD